jgi:hypothetical protein
MKNKSLVKSAYDFYKLPLDVREVYIGQEYPVNDRYVYLGINWCERSMYYNYCQKIGLIYFSSIADYKGKAKSCFSVGVFSPDDWDCSFSIDESIGNLELLRKEMIDWMKEHLSMGEIDHVELFEMFQEKFSISKEWGVGVR